MTVTKKIQEIWKRAIKEATQAEVAKRYDLAPATISRAVHHGRCNQETFNKLNKFVLDHKAGKRKLIEQLDGE